MAQAFVVGNRIGKKKGKKKSAPSARPKRKARNNPLEAVITGAGFNPRKGKSMAKKKGKKKHSGARAGNPRRRRNEPNARRRRRTAHNPILPVETKRVPGLVVGGVTGAVGSVWIPQLILPSVTGWLSFILNAAVAVLGAWGLGALNAPNAALGWLIGGLSATFGLILDKVTGKQIIQVSAPMGQFYRRSGVYLPSAVRSDLTTVGPPQPAAAALPAAVPVTGSQKAKTMGWSQLRRRAG